MKILIANGYVRENKGDAALISVLVGQLKGAFPGADISIASLEDPLVHPDFYGTPNVGSLQLYGGMGSSFIARIFRKLFVVAAGSILPYVPFRKTFIKSLPRPMRGELLAILEADLVIGAGGGYLIGENSLAGNLNLFFIALPFWLSERFGKATMFAPESFGPFDNQWQRKFIRTLLNRARIVFVREEKSYDILKGIRVPEAKLVRAPDSAFAEEAHRSASNSRAQTHPAPRTDAPMRVGITARAWLKGDAEKKYETALARFIVNIKKEYGAQSILIPQVTASYNTDDDRLVEKRIKDLAVAEGVEPVHVIDEMNHYEIKKMYASCDFTVGTRFHSVIFSLISHVPAIAIEYEHKTSGIMQELGIGEWTIKIEDVTAEKLMDLFSRMVKASKEYRGHLAQVLPAYIANANKVSDQIREAYTQYI